VVVGIDIVDEEEEDIVTIDVVRRWRRRTKYRCRGPDELRLRGRSACGITALFRTK